MDFAERLKIVRKKKGFSQQKLANIVGVHVTNISRYERGENHPTATILAKLGQALEISAEALISGDTQEDAENEVTDKDLLIQFKKASLLPVRQKVLIKEFLEAFIITAELRERLLA